MRWYHKSAENQQVVATSNFYITFCFY